MGQKSSQITRDIENTRAELGSNLQELEDKVKEITDWRKQFEKSPLTMIGLAFGGGIVLGTATGGHHSSRREYSQREYSQRAGNGHSSPRLEERFGESDKATTSQLKRASDTWDTIKGALIGVAAGRVQDFLNEVVPGFSEEFHRVQKREHPQLAADNTPPAGTI